MELSVLELEYRVIAINKADGDNAQRAQVARRQLQSALTLMRPKTDHWKPPVLTCSGLHGDGVAEVWARVLDHEETLRAAGELQRRRQQQRLRWMWAAVEDTLMATLTAHPGVAGVLPDIRRRVLDDTLPPTAAALELLAAFGVEGL